MTNSPLNQNNESHIDLTPANISAWWNFCLVLPIYITLWELLVSILARKASGSHHAHPHNKKKKSLVKWKQRAAVRGQTAAPTTAEGDAQTEN